MFPGSKRSEEHDPSHLLDLISVAGSEQVGILHASIRQEFAIRILPTPSVNFGLCAVEVIVCFVVHDQGEDAKKACEGSGHGRELFHVK
ncbi:MAG: hypothetical protein IT577_21700 [Verrucomicrobiae bacterium]|nr:hypothetical protein [Verrucomicrobiae bacterium]